MFISFFKLRSCGFLADLLTAFENDSFYTGGVFEVACYFCHDRDTDTHIIMKVMFDDKTNAVNFYKTIARNWESYGTESTRQYQPNFDHSFLRGSLSTDYYNSGQVRCFLRNGEMSDNAVMAPHYNENVNWFNHWDTITYSFTPSIRGYNRRGGAQIITHISHMIYSYNHDMDDGTTPNIDVDAIVFRVNVANDFNTFSSSFDPTTDNALWGPFYRYQPQPENMLQYQPYLFPSIKKGNEIYVVDDDPGNITTIDLSGDADLNTNLSGFFNGVNSVDPTLDGLDEVPSCGTLSSSILYISKGNKQCSYSNGVLTCTTDISLKTPDPDLTGLNVVGNPPFCKDSNGGRWLTLAITPQS